MRRNAWLAVLCCAFFSDAFFIAGCTKVGPDFHRPEVVVVQDWKETENPSIKSAPADSRDWWQAFNDPVLNRLIDRAYGQNLPLRIAGLRVLEARALLGIAVGTFTRSLSRPSDSLNTTESARLLLGQPSSLAKSSGNPSLVFQLPGRSTFGESSGARWSRPMPVGLPPSPITITSW